MTNLLYYPQVRPLRPSSRLGHLCHRLKRSHLLFLQSRFNRRCGLLLGNLTRLTVPVVPFLQRKLLRTISTDLGRRCSLGPGSSTILDLAAMSLLLIRGKGLGALNRVTVPLPCCRGLPKVNKVDQQSPQPLSRHTDRAVKMVCTGHGVEHRLM